MTTNGTLIDALTAEKLMACGVGHLHFSVDGLKKAHDSMRGEGSYESTMEAIKTVDALRKKKGGGPSVGIACVVMRSNIEDLYPLLRGMDDIHVDVVTFLPLLLNNALTPDRGQSLFWPLPDQLDVLDGEIEKIKNFKGKHTAVYEEPGLRLFSKYYRRTLTASDWKCFTGYKTVFICVGDDGSPLVYTCHGICGDLSRKELKKCWLSTDAMKLRRQGKACVQPCLQSCYSRVASDSLMGVFRNFFGECYGPR